MDFLVDNSRSERDIKEIRCSLTYTVTVRKGEETLQTMVLDMALMEVNGVKGKKRQETRERFVFDLKKIFGEYAKGLTVKSGIKSVKMA